MRSLRTSIPFLILAIASGCSRPAQKPAASSELITKHFGTADVLGIIHFEGTPPPRKTLDTGQDPNCGGPVESESVMVDNGRLQNVYVYIKAGAPAGTFAPPKVPAILEQRGCRYIPHVLGIELGRQLQIENDDNTMHNVHAGARVNEGRNLSQDAHATPAITKFDQPELMIPVQCNVHPWMKMYVNVSPNEYFSVSRRDGVYDIGWLPPGTYTVAALHEKLGEKTQQVTIKEKGEQVKIDFTFSAADLH